MSPRRSIVIVTPGQLGSNPRVVKEASALHDAGFAVHVIATRVLDMVEPRDSAVMEVAPWSVERIPFNDRKLWRGERAFQEVARRVQKFAPSARLTSYAHSAFSRRIAAASVRHPADLYIAHYPAALEGAARAATRHGSRFAFDAEDFHPGDLPERPELSAARGLISAIERRHLPRVAYMSAASPGIAEAYARTYAIPRPTVIRNVFEAACAPGAPTSKGSEPGPSLYWFSQVIGPDRGLECALEAIAQAKSAPHLYLRGTPQRGFADRLVAQAAGLGCADRLHLLEPAAPAEMVHLAAQFDVGLVGETGATENRRIALTNKQFTYLLAGVPGVMSDVPAHVEFAAEAEGAAFLYKTGDSVSLAAALDHLFGDPARLAAARARAFKLGQDRFNWELESKVFVDIVRRTLNETRA